jgi:AcrR family transcriptional regulator
VSEVVALPTDHQLLIGRARGGTADRIIDGTCRCVARWGVAKTTLDDIARDAGCSRATVYRVFPGGKDAVLAAAWCREVTSFSDELAAALAAETTLEGAIVRTITAASQAIASHEALQFLLEHEPGAILPYLSFDGLDPLLGWAAAFAVTAYERFLPAAPAAELGEWLARIVVSYGFEPTDCGDDLAVRPEPPVDLADEAVATAFVECFVLPGVSAAPSAPSAPPAASPTPSPTASQE